MKIFRPPNYSGLLLIVLLVFMIAGLLYVKRNNLEFLYNRTTWSLIVIVNFFIFHLLAQNSDDLNKLCCLKERNYNIHFGSNVESNPWAAIGASQRSDRSNCKCFTKRDTFPSVTNIPPHLIYSDVSLFNYILSRLGLHIRRQRLSISC